LVGIVGRLVPIKDVHTAISAIAELDAVHLAVVGDGELRNELEEFARGTGAAARVHFTGWRHDVAETLSELDVAVLTSRNEGTPVALIEASAVGVPAVATEVGGVRSGVDDGRTGLLVPPGDAGAVARNVTQLLVDPASRTRMGTAARDHVRDRFGAERLLADIKAFYKDLLG
jgi:glycosyltransferase involved in cell wall biosynthesis